MFVKQFGAAGEHEIGLVFWSPEVQAILNDPLHGATNREAGVIENKYWDSVRIQDAMEGKVPMAGFIGANMKPALREWLQLYVSGTFVPEERKMAAQIKLEIAMNRGNGPTIGKMLFRSAKLEQALPLSLEQAKLQGYTIVEGCSRLGLYRASKSEQLTQRRPTAVYYAANGLISGFSIDSWGPPFPTALASGFYQVIDSSKQHYRLNILFRSELGLCKPAVLFQSRGIGDQVVILNQKGGPDWKMPLTSTNAGKQGFTKGACLPQMGLHYTMDLSRKDGTMSYNARELHPVVGMYDEDGSISGILIQSFTSQQSLTSTNEWDIFPIPNSVACGNFCDRACQWTNHEGMFGSLHLFFKDYNKIRCTSGMCGKTGMVDTLKQKMMSVQLPSFMR